MTFNYRVVKYRTGGFGLHEVYYENGKAMGRTENPCTFVCGEDEGASSVLGAIAMAYADAARKPVFIDPENWPTGLDGAQ